MVNEPGKMSNLNTLRWRGYVDHSKKLKDKLGRKFALPFNLVISLLKAWNFLGDGSIYERRA